MIKKPKKYYDAPDPVRWFKELLDQVDDADGGCDWAATYIGENKLYEICNTLLWLSADLVWNPLKTLFNLTDDQVWKIVSDEIKNIYGVISLDLILTNDTENPT